MGQALAPVGPAPRVPHRELHPHSSCFGTDSLVWQSPSERCQPCVPPGPTLRSNSFSPYIPEAAWTGDSSKEPRLLQLQKCLQTTSSESQKHISSSGGPEEHDLRHLRPQQFGGHVGQHFSKTSFSTYCTTLHQGPNFSVPQFPHL